MSGRDGDRLDAVREIFPDIADNYDQVALFTTLGMDALWKRRILSSVPSGLDPDRILDLGCGGGKLTFGLADRYPDANVVGIDVLEEMIAEARRRNSSDRIEFEQLRVRDLDAFEERSFDLVAGSYLAKYTDVDVLAERSASLLEPGGFAVFHDLTYPRNRFYRLAYDFHWFCGSLVMRVVPGWDGSVPLLKEQVVEGASWVDDLPVALERRGFEAVETWWQPLQRAAIVTGRKTA